MAYTAVLAAKIDAREARRGADEFKQSTDQMVQSATAAATRIHDRFTGVFGGLKGQIASMAAQFGLAFGAFEIAKNIVQTAASFELLRKNLETATGSAYSADRAFEFIKKFADDAPGSIEDVTQAYIKLVQLGIDPTAGALEALGNLAAVRNQNIAQAADTVVGAALGRAMQLKELGIVAEDANGKLVLSFGTARATVEKNVPAMIAGVIKLADGVKDAMARADDSVTGAFGDINLQFRIFADQVGKAGLNDALKDFARTIRFSVEDANSFADAVGKTLATAVNAAKDSFIWARDNADTLKSVLAALVALRLLPFAADVVVLTKALRDLGIASLLVQAANPVGLAALVTAGGIGAIYYADQQAKQRAADRDAMATPKVRSLVTGAPVSTEPHMLGVSDFPKIADATRQKKQLDDTVAAQAAAQAAAAQAEADKKAREKAQSDAESAAKKAIEDEQKRQQAIADTLEQLRQEKSLSEQVAAATASQSGLAEAQATGNVDAVDRILESTRALTVAQDTLKAAQQAGIQAFLDEKGAIVSVIPKEQDLVNQYRAAIDATSKATEEAKKYGDAHDFVKAAIENALTPAEKYAVALANINREFALNANGGPLSAAEAIAEAKAEADVQKAALQDWKQQVGESENLGDLGRKMFSGFDDQVQGFANSLSQYGIGTVNEFTNSLIEMQREGDWSLTTLGDTMTKFVTDAIFELERLVMQTLLAKAAMMALGAGGFGFPGLLGGGGGVPAVANVPFNKQTTDTTGVALQNSRLNGSGNAMRFDVNVVNSPSKDAPQVQMTQTSNGIQLDLIYQGAENHIIERAARGGGIAPLLKAGGWNPATGLGR